MSRTIKKFVKNHPEKETAKRTVRLNKIKDQESKQELKQFGFA